MPPPGFLQRGRALVHSSGGGDAQDQAHTPGLLWAAVLHPRALTHSASSFRRGCAPASRRRAGSCAEVWAEPASGAPGTPTGPARPEQSAGGGEERERLCTEGEVGTRRWWVSMRCGTPNPMLGGQKGGGGSFPRRATSVCAGVLKDGWRDSWEEPSSLNYATRWRPSAGCCDEWNW